MIQSFFAQQITFPIQKEIQAFEQIKRTQDYSIRLETNQKDEFSKLAISINELLDYIEKEKTISDTIRFHGNYVTALKTIIWDMDFDENDKKLFTADDSIEIIKDLVSNKES